MLNRGDASSSPSPVPLSLQCPPCLFPSDDEPLITLPIMPLGQEVMIDYSTTGLSLKQHPVALVREELDEAKNSSPPPSSCRRRTGRWVRVAGLVLIRQRPGTASGIVFETLEDETGIVNLIVKPDIYDRYRPAARHAALLRAMATSSAAARSSTSWPSDCTTSATCWAATNYSPAIFIDVPNSRGQHG